MPNWKIHIEVAKRINKFLAFKDEEYDAFLFGNVLPDINNSFVVTPVSKRIPHAQTHFKNQEKSTYEAFAEKYERKLKAKDPLYWGYFLHLFTDYNWNKNYYESVAKTKLKDKDPIELKKIKHHDFKIYNEKYQSNKLNINDLDKFVNKANEIEEISITKEDVEQVQSFLNQKIISSDNYFFYDEKRLDQLFSDTITKFNDHFLF